MIFQLDRDLGRFLPFLTDISWDFKDFCSHRASDGPDLFRICSKHIKVIQNERSQL